MRSQFDVWATKSFIVSEDLGGVTTDPSSLFYTNKPCNLAGNYPFVLYDKLIEQVKGNLSDQGQCPKDNYA